MAPYRLLLPMKLDVFIFNSAVCSGGPDQAGAKIAPITQPNYTFLQLKDHLAQNDILEHVDLHNSSPSSRNPRFTDIGKARTRLHRLGAYIHWSLPRPLRSGIAASAPDGTTTTDPSAPTYHAIPNRWLVIRSLKPDADTPVPGSLPDGLKPVMAWVVESDRTRSIDQLPDSVDLEVDVAPFVTSFIEEGKTAGDIKVEQQAEIFIGSCTPAAEWEADETTRDGEVRVGLTAASSSNPFFIDYQYHCGNVFSMLDTFSYTSSDGATTEYLKSALVDYYVIGWHSDCNKDIMAPSVDLKDKPRTAHLDRLRVSVTRSIPPEDKSAIDSWLDTPGATRTLCHGAMYDVRWTRDAAPDHIPADDVAAHFASPDKTPFAVGTSPIDAVLAFLSHRNSSGHLEKGLLALQALLRSDEDGVDAQMAAEDEIQASNYAHFDGGNHFFLPAESAGKNVGADPDETVQDGLRLQNSGQHLLDAINRRLQQLRWEMFAWWWCQISDVDKKISTTADERDVRKVEKEIKELVAFAELIKTSIVGTVKAPVKTGVMEGFHQRSDPTLVVGGVQSGWPTDFNDVLQGRLENQVINSGIAVVPTEACVDRVPKNLQDAAEGLVREFFSIKDTKAGLPADRIPPLYHDGKRPKDPVDQDANPGRDRWSDSQPWFPLYVEWEAEYAHIDFDSWEMQPRPPRGPESASKTTYVLKKDIRMKKPEEGWKDIRYVSGRSLVLPQPSFSLKVHIDRLFATIPPAELDRLLTKDEKKAVLTQLDQLTLLSMPLEGLTDHLTTRFQGSHVKPLVREPGKPPVVLQEALDAIKPYVVDLSLIEQETDPTPYGTLQALVGQTISGFKPVTHGQMRFTKINIIDKFGQVVHAIDPREGMGKPLHPSLSAALDVDRVPGEPDGIPNVVDPRWSTFEYPEYVQLSPYINQPARLNAHFVVHGNPAKGEHKWRPATEFDKPIWGWVVINYVDNGLQFFLGDGRFYREVRNTKSSVDWLPFGRPPGFDGSSTRQLDALIKRLVGDKNYLEAFFDMVRTKLSTTVPAPTTYSQFLNSLVGRPLALANMGWSLELGTKPKGNESTLYEQQQAEKEREWGLLPSEGQKQYTFQLKLGDQAHNYDGLVCYFDTASDGTDKDAPASPDPEPGNDLNLSTIYTYFYSSKNSQGPLVPIDTTTYPRLPAFWLDPKKYIPDEDTKPADLPEQLAAESRRHERERNANLRVFGVLFDPFAPVVGFSGSVLPPRSLTLPSWTWEKSLKAMTTFFHAGPLVLTNNVPDFRADCRLDDPAKGGDAGPVPAGATVPGSVVALPALRAADWAWLQPYDLGPGDDPQGYMALNVDGAAVGERPEWKRGPLTAVEGFMQLKEAIEQGKE